MWPIPMPIPIMGPIMGPIIGPIMGPTGPVLDLSFSPSNRRERASTWAPAWPQNWMRLGQLLANAKKSSEQRTFSAQPAGPAICAWSGDRWHIVARMARFASQIFTDWNLVKGKPRARAGEGLQAPAASLGEARWSPAHAGIAPDQFRCACKRILRWRVQLHCMLVNPWPLSFFGRERRPFSMRGAWYIFTPKHRLDTKDSAALLRASIEPH